MATDLFHLSVQNVSLSFGGIQALTGVSFDARKGEILAIIGPNGAGKTSMLNCINNFYHPDKGQIVFEGHDLTRLPPHRIAQLGVARTFQNIALYTGLSTLDNLMAARHIHMRAGFLQSLAYWGPAHREDIAHRQAVEEIIDFLEMAHIRKAIVGALPYGLRKRVELGRALAMEPRLLLLDEPMTGMNSGETETMMDLIKGLQGRGLTVLLVEHDMRAVMGICERIVVLTFGRKIAEGSPQEIREDKEVIRAYLGAERHAY